MEKGEKRPGSLLFGHDIKLRHLTDTLITLQDGQGKACAPIAQAPVRLHHGRIANAMSRGDTLHMNARTDRDMPIAFGQDHGRDYVIERPFAGSSPRR